MQERYHTNDKEDRDRPPRRAVKSGVTLIGSGHAPRKVIGSVNAAEFFITVAAATTFLIELGTAHVEHIAPLIIGGVLAAPFGGYIVRHVRPHALMAAVGGLVSAVALFQFIKSFP